MDGTYLTYGGPRRIRVRMETTTTHHPMDPITARMFGQYLTLRRYSWEELRDDAIPGTDTHERAHSIAQRDGDPADECAHGISALRDRAVCNECALS